MKKILAIVLCMFSINCFADVPRIALDKAHVNLKDVESIKRGAKFFLANCMSCHTMVYLRYNTLAQKAGVLYEKMPTTVKTWPLGVVPPDLSLATSIHGADWVYTYLHSFYMDASRPYGVNNLVVPNTAMPAIIVPLQGQQVLVTDLKGSEKIYQHQWQWYDLLKLQTAGSLSPSQFDATINDVVNFLAYAAEPFHEEEVHLGYWVIGFLCVFFVLAYLLKQEYWRDVKKSKEP